MRDGIPLSIMSGMYTSGGVALLAGAPRRQIVPIVLVGTACAGGAHGLNDFVFRPLKRGYLDALPAGRSPTISGWLYWSLVPTSGQEWSQALFDRWELLIYGADFKEVRTRIRRQREMAQAETSADDSTERRPS